MMQYKTNLSVLNSRYGDLEKRVLETFAEAGTVGLGERIVLHGMGVLLRYLLQDGLIVQVQPDRWQVQIMGMPSHEYFALTEAGQEFIDRWLRAQELDGACE
jgi:hypothetical protein